MGAQGIGLLILCTVNKGDRVAQLILERIVTPEVVEVDVSRSVPRPKPDHAMADIPRSPLCSPFLQDLSTTVRGAGGFGSTGGFGAAPVAVAATKPEEAVNFVEPSA